MCSVQVSITIEDFNDNYPEFPLPHIIHINEAADVNSVVATVVANDADVGANGNVTYTLLSHTQVFAIGPNNGQLKVCCVYIAAHNAMQFLLTSPNQHTFLFIAGFTMALQA